MKQAPSFRDNQGVRRMAELLLMPPRPQVVDALFLELVSCLAKFRERYPDTKILEVKLAIRSFAKKVFFEG